MPRMLRDILARVIEAQTDMCIVGTAEPPSMLSAEVSRLSPDVVIVGLEDGEPPTMCGRLLFAHPLLKVIAFGERARRASLFELRPHEERIPEVSAAGLVETIRESMRGVPHTGDVS